MLQGLQPIPRRWGTPWPCWEEPGVLGAVGLAASAGGFGALAAVLSQLPEQFPAPIFLAHHRGGSTASFIDLMRRRTRLTVKEARDGEAPMARTVYIAPHARHIAVHANGTVCVCLSRRLRYVRPSADLLFTSLAERYGNRAVAVVLTGTGNDGARGVCAIRDAGGYVMCQSVPSSQHGGMPSAAIETRKVDIVLTLQSIGFALSALAGSLLGTS
jgi:two-component system chemotaxis response regulator CheB